MTNKDKEQLTRILQIYLFSPCQFLHLFQEKQFYVSNLQQCILFTIKYMLLLLSFYLSSMVNSYGHVGMVSLPHHTFPGQAYTCTLAVNQYSVHILSQVTDNFPSWISGRERMIVEKISWSIATKEWCQTRAASPWSPEHQSGTYQTELLSPAILSTCTTKTAVSHSTLSSWAIMKNGYTCK